MTYLNTSFQSSTSLLLNERLSNVVSQSNLNDCDGQTRILLQQGLHAVKLIPNFAQQGAILGKVLKHGNEPLLQMFFFLTTIRETSLGQALARHFLILEITQGLYGPCKFFLSLKKNLDSEHYHLPFKQDNLCSFPMVLNISIHPHSILKVK